MTTQTLLSCQGGDIVLPKYPNYVDSKKWTENKEHLSSEECSRIVTHVEKLLVESYAISKDSIQPQYSCMMCKYPSPANEANNHICLEQAS